MIVEIFCFICGILFLAEMLLIIYVIKHEKENKITWR